MKYVLWIRRSAYGMTTIRLTNKLWSDLIWLSCTIKALWSDWKNMQQVTRFSSLFVDISMHGPRLLSVALLHLLSVHLYGLCEFLVGLHLGVEYWKSRRQSIRLNCNGKSNYFAIWRFTRKLNMAPNFEIQGSNSNVLWRSLILLEYFKEGQLKFTTASFVSDEVEAWY